MAVQQRSSGIIGWARSQVDQAVSPSVRQRYYDNISAYASEQPLVFTFLLTQFLLSFTPLALFTTFILGTLAFSLITALLFSLFWLGIALLVLVPTLFIITSLGIVLWIWAVSSFFVAKWLYNLVPVNVRGGAEVSMPNGKKVFVEKTGEGYGDIKGEVRDSF